MAFAQQYPRPFTQAGIGELRREQYGVYGISTGSVWIYIGKGHIRERLLAHFKGDNACIRSQRPTHFVCEVSDNERRQPGKRADRRALSYLPVRGVNE